MYRPLAGVVLLGKQVATPPSTIGVSGVALGFAVLIVLGTVVLSLPMSRAPGQGWDLLDALFTATSAVCVTGLVVVDTGTHWSPLGQAVILGLIQLGVMTASMFILIILRRPISFRDRFELREAAQPGNIRSVAGILWATVLLSVILEMLGAAALWYRLGGLEGNHEALWFGVFHSVSAFNNAGFDLTGNFASLTPFNGDPAILLIVAALVILGGLGALVLIDLLNKRSWKALATHSKIVLCTSGILLAVGFAGILGAEYTNANTLGALGLVDKLTNAFFHSAVARTAGFATLDMGQLNDETQFLYMALMYIGGASGSTAGGIKVTTLAVLVLATLTSIRGYEHASAFGARIGHRLVYRALAMATLALAVVFVATMVLMVTEHFLFRQMLFEVVSAFATVGVTTGITPDLSVAGKLTIIIVMYLGRLGPLTLAYALAQRAREPSYQFPERDVGIG